MRSGTLGDKLFLYRDRPPEAFQRLLSTLDVVSQEVACGWLAKSVSREGLVGAVSVAVAPPGTPDGAQDGVHSEITTRVVPSDLDKPERGVDGTSLADPVLRRCVTGNVIRDGSSQPLTPPASPSVPRCQAST